MLLTRLPVVWAPTTLIPLDRTVWAFPLIGLEVGVVGVFAATITLWLHLSPIICAALIIAAELLATGALHEDGLADTVDGLGGGRTRERKLEIMRDSRIGSFGALALMLALLIRASAIAEIVGAGHGWIFGCLLAAAAMGRGAMLIPIAALRPARADGLASGLTASSRGRLIAGAALALACSQFAPGVPGLCGAAGAIVGGLVLLHHPAKHLGGYTGDTLGATCVVAECCALAGMAAALTS